MKTGLRSLALGIALCVAAGNASALSYVMMRDSDLLSESQGVVTATIIDRRPAKDGERETRYKVRITGVLAGAAISEERWMVLPGTFDAPTINWQVFGVPNLKLGSELLLFYSARADGVLQPQQLTLGLFAKTEIGDESVYVRYLERPGDFSKDAGTRHYHFPREAKSFERWIRNSAAGKPVESDYFVEDSDGSLQKFAFSNFTIGGNTAPGRWFQFDTDQSLQWTARPDGQANTAVDEFASVAAALAGWTNDPTSRITMGYAGTAAAQGSCTSGNEAACFSGHVKWNDPNGEIAGSFTNGGTLAIGGSSAITPLRTFNSSSWYARLIAGVTVQDGAGVGTVMDGNGGANGVELLVHEIGHSIGFGHSCEFGQGQCVADTDADNATMRSFLHSDGRGAALGVDDIAGAAVIYPAPAGTSVGPTLNPTPASGSNTNMAGGDIGVVVSNNISFTTSGGAGAGTTNLACTASGAVTIFSGGTQNNIARGATPSNVVVRATLTASQQTGRITCTATGGASTQNLTFDFTAPAGNKVCGVGQVCTFYNGFES